jgi:aminoglycoside 2'-N-acetyltransferase I
MTEIQTAHTADLCATTLDAAWELLVDAFEGDISTDDWEHALGGIHALAWDDGELVGHASVIQRRLLHDDRALRTGYVEGVGVRADYRRRGVGLALMSELERFIRGGFELGALGATDNGAKMYKALGWRLWEGPLSALTPSGVQRTPDVEGAIYVLEVGGGLDVTGELTCDWRGGDVW